MTQGYSSDKQIIRGDQVGSHQTNDKRWASKVHSYSKKGGYPRRNRVIRLME